MSLKYPSSESIIIFSTSEEELFKNVSIIAFSVVWLLKNNDDEICVKLFVSVSMMSSVIAGLRQVKNAGAGISTI